MVGLLPVLRRCLLTLPALLLLFVAVSSLPPTLAAAQNARPASYVAGDLIVKFKDAADPLDDFRADALYPAALHTRLAARRDPAQRAFAGLLSRYTLRSAATRHADHLYRLQLDTRADMVAVAKDFAANPAVEYAEPNYTYRIARAPNDPSYLDGTQWSLNKISMPAAWDITTGSSSVVVAVLDTGVRSNHPDLQGKLVTGYNYAYNNADTNDDEGHGTHVAGIIAANSNNGIGISGIAWGSRIMPVKVLNSDGGGNSLALANGIRFAADNGARIINTSLGSAEGSRYVSDAVSYALGKGVIFIASSGNDGNNTPNYPAALPGVISVGASTANDGVAFFSSYGTSVSVVAPGIAIYSLSTASDGDYSSESGTSFSSPIVAGVAALMLAVNPNLTAVQVRNILEGTADDLVPAGRDDKSGFGRINAYRALTAVRSGDLSPNHKSIIQGVVRNSPGDAYINITPGYNVGLSNGTFSVATGNGLYYVTAVSARGIVGPLAVRTTGQSGNVVSVYFDFANSQFGIGTPPTTTPPTTQPPTPTPTAPPTPIAPLTPTPFDQAKALFNRQPAQTSTPTKSYFTETGHTLSEPFKAYWEQNGGLSIFGFPISESFNETSQTDGKVYVVQYFERNRFEYHPEAPQQYRVLLGLLGRELTKGRSFPDASPLNISAPYLFFAQTKHNLSGKFLTYWQTRGGLSIFGYPINEVTSETSTTDGKTYQTQYLERNRYELHPENAGTQYEVLLGLLGKDLAASRGYITK